MARVDASSRSPLRRAGWASLVVALLMSMGCDHPHGGTRDVSAKSATPPPPSPTVAATKPMVIAFSRDFCLPCQVMAPDVEKLRRTTAGDVDVVHVNVDREANEQFALFFVVKTVPEQVYVDASGRIVRRHAGIATADEMRATLRRLGWAH